MQACQCCLPHAMKIGKYVCVRVTEFTSVEFRLVRFDSVVSSLTFDRAPTLTKFPCAIHTTSHAEIVHVQRRTRESAREMGNPTKACSLALIVIVYLYCVLVGVNTLFAGIFVAQAKTSTWNMLTASPISNACEPSLNLVQVHGMASATFNVFFFFSPSLLSLLSCCVFNCSFFGVIAVALHTNKSNIRNIFQLQSVFQSHLHRYLITKALNKLH